MRRPRLACLALAGIAAALTTPVRAQGIDTRVMVRVLAHDAKLIGTSVGGARVTVTDVASGAVLASGTTAGGTGDTRLIMDTPHERGTPYLDTEGAAGFQASFTLARPTLVAFSAVGPLDFPQAESRASKVMMLEPGDDIAGDGVVLELHGLIVEVLDAPAPTVDDGVAVRARVRMLCSCPTEPDGRWTVERVVARLMDGSRVVAETGLAYAGETSTYAGVLRPPGAGTFTLVVVANDTDGGNNGVGSREVVVR